MDIKPFLLALHVSTLPWSLRLWDLEGVMKFALKVISVVMYNLATRLICCIFMFGELTWSSRKILGGHKKGIMSKNWITPEIFHVFSTILPYELESVHVFSTSFEVKYSTENLAILARKYNELSCNLFADLDRFRPKWPWCSINIIFSMLLEGPIIHICCTFGDISLKMWRIIKQKVVFGRFGQLLTPKWSWGSRTINTIFNTLLEGPTIHIWYKFCDTSLKTW